MSRSLLLTALALVGAVGGLTIADARFPAPGAPGPRQGLMVVDGVTYEAVTLFPVFAAVRSDTAGFLTLDEGLTSGEVIVREMGDATLRRNRDGRPLPVSGDEVNRLVLVNRGRKPLILLAGELVSGGKQDRIIGKDRIIPVGAEPLPLDVFCVEHGRWTGATQFNASKVIVHPSVREQAAVVQRQDGVWASVRAGTTAPAPAVAESVVRPAEVSRRTLDGVISSAAPTESYAKVYRESRIGQSADVFAAELERRFRRAAAARKDGRLVGVVVAYGGEVAWSDVFASSELFERYWPKLLRSYVTEALARPVTRERASVDAASDFIEPLHGHEQVDSEPGVYRLRQVTEGMRVEIDLQSLPSALDLHVVNIRRTGPAPQW